MRETPTSKLIIEERLPLGVQPNALFIQGGAACSAMVEHPLVVQWVVRSIHHGGRNELLLAPASAPRLV